VIVGRGLGEALVGKSWKMFGLALRIMEDRDGENEKKQTICSGDGGDPDVDGNGCVMCGGGG